MTKKPHPIDVHVGTELRRQRCYAGFSQTALAERLGITFQQLQKYESAANRVSASRLWDSAEALAMSVEAFFPAPSSGRPRLAWHEDAAFLRWVRLYSALAEDDRRILLEIAKKMPKRNVSGW